MKPFAATAFVWILVATSGALRADDADPTGVWKWVDDPTRKTIEISELTLKKDGDRLIGSLFHYNTEFPRLPKAGQNQIRRNVTRPISEGTVQNGEVSFKVVRSFKGRKVVTTYTAKVRGDRLKGKIEAGGKSRDWEAKRADD